MYACTDVSVRDFGASTGLESDCSIVESRRNHKFWLAFGVKDSTTFQLTEFKTVCGDIAGP